MKVTKRNGLQEEADFSKISRVIDWASEGLENVSTSMVEMHAKIQMHDGIKTSDIHKTIVKAAADLISEDTPDYQYLAGRLAIFDIRKAAYGEYMPPALLDHVIKMVDLNKYDAHLINDYDADDYKFFEEIIDHTRDLNLTYASVKQLEGKYLNQNRVTGRIYESPQMIYMLVGMALYASIQDKQQRREKVAKFYEATSLHKISLPTPIMAGVRTPTRQFSSCVLIESGDSLDSINATSTAIVRYISQRAGIGINGGGIRAIGSEIRQGEAYHTGVIPFYKYFHAAVKSCSQGGVRGGNATLFYPLWHYEFESLIVLKNNRGVEENRIRHLDYGVQINKYLYNRMLKGENISLFSPYDVPGLYTAFFSDQDEFARLYELAEADATIRRKTIKAIEAFSLIMQERASTGRIYIQNVDNTNINGPFDEFVAPVKQSNLCLEIALPTSPIEHIDDPKGEIALCTLSAFNLGAITELAEMEELAEIVVEALDRLLDYQDYPVLAAELSTMKRRTLGVGIINLAYYLAKNGVRYSDGSANQLVHETFEAMQYYLLKASNKLAREKGACPGFGETKYAKGIMPIDRYKKSLDEYFTCDYKMDWDSLRQDILTHGLRNSTLTALMPSESSSQVSNATNGIEPPRGLVSIKSSKDGNYAQVVPDYQNLKDKYELLWDIPDNKGYLTLVGIMQKFVDQAISANTNYDPKRFPGEMVPVKVMIQDLLMCHKLGVKTLYYHNTRDHASDKVDVEVKQTSAESGDDCDSCKI